MLSEVCVQDLAIISYCYLMAVKDMNLQISRIIWCIRQQIVRYKHVCGGSIRPVSSVACISLICIVHLRIVHKGLKAV